MAEIAEQVTVTLSRGKWSKTVEFDHQPTEEERGKFRAEAEAFFNHQDATDQEPSMQDRRRPK